MYYSEILTKKRVGVINKYIKARDRSNSNVLNGRKRFKHRGTGFQRDKNLLPNRQKKPYKQIAKIGL